jgi:hypothetical protein
METVILGHSVADWLVYASAVVGAASTIAAALPQPTEGSVLWYARKVLDWAALNIANAKNARKE